MEMRLIKIWMVLANVHLRVDIIRPTLNTCLYNVRPNLIVRHNADAYPCSLDKDAELGLVFNVYNLNF